MSYQVLIRRLESRPILRTEIEALLEGDPELLLEPISSSHEGEQLLSFSTEDQTSKTTLLFSAGELQSTTTPTDAALLKMQQISRALGARLLGEEGEDLTELDLRPGEPSTRAALGCLAIVLGVAGALLWWWLG